ncbi:hypothetical protein P886_1479 [Alteromonadaceae bacterium 2753L.S.0a.02]|nr:hypothetical protein P886_1479 [Alteromonadaceae bacterium 2753L.S.0a.02]
MYIGFKLLRWLGIFVLATLWVDTALASTLIPSYPEDTKVLINPNAESDYITLNKANASGISVNVFSDFSVSGKALRLLHGGLQDADYQPAKLIVIKSSRITIESTVELVGESANVLFIDTDSATTSNLSCIACAFKNFGRITLASATTQNDITNTISNLGKLSTFSGSTVSIDGLKTNGAHSIEIIAERVNTLGEIDTNIRGNLDVNGGYTVVPNGSKVIAVAGINLYLGTAALDYETLNVTSHTSTSPYNAEQVIDGSWKGAMINIIASSPIRLKQSASLSTDSDLLATSMHDGEFNALLEGIYLQTNRENYGNIRLDGAITTDNLIQIIAQGELNISGHLQSHRADVFAKGAIQLTNNAEIRANVTTIGSDWFSNMGSIRSSALNVETQKALYNHFGGELSGDVITLVSLDGTVINGSRTDKLYMPSDLPAVYLDPEFKGNDKYGVYQSVSSEAGAIQSNLSASITGNEINIKAIRFENINPYGITKSQSETWDQGITLQVGKSRRVSVLAESALKINASAYVLNSSAVIGLNQSGSLDINTPLLMNQRYRVEAMLAVYSKESFDLSGVTATASKTNVNEIETYLTAYSPPGVFYSFGELNFSDGIENNAEDADFINQFSFVEVLSDSNFHESQLHSIGLAMAARPLLGFDPVRCAVYGCSASSYVSLIESETLTSFGGNVYGISSDLTVQTVNQLEDASKQAIVDEFVAKRREEVAYEQTFINPTSVGGDVYQHHYLYKWEVVSNGVSELLVLTVNRCTKIEYYSGNISSTCVPYIEQYDLQAMLSEEAGGNLINGLPWTGDEVAAKAKVFIEGTSHSGSLDVPGYSTIYGTYVRSYVVNKVSDDREYILIDYSEKFQPNNASSLEEAESRTAGYYHNTGSVTLRIEELMGSVVPSIPSGLTLNYSLGNGQVTYNAAWNSINQSNITYHLSSGGSTTGTSYQTTRSISAGNTSFSIKVKACNTVTCSNWSSAVAVEFQVQPTPSELSNCISSFYTPFSYQFKMPFSNGYGNYCAVTTKNGVAYYVIAQQREAEDPGNNKYARCELVKYYNRDAIVSAILNETAFPAISFTEWSTTYHQDCNDFLSFSLTILQ